MSRLFAAAIAALLAIGIAVPAAAQSAQSFYDRGNSRFSSDIEAAIADYSEAVRIDPTFADAWFNRGNGYAALGDHDRAIADYSMVAKLNPRYANAFYNRGNSYLAKGAYDAAIADYSQVVAISPSYGVAYFQRANAYAALGQDDLAIADYGSALKFDPGNGFAWYNRGNSQSKLGRYDLAIADYAEAIRLMPDYAPARLNQGNAYRNSGRFEDAVAAIREALKLDPGLDRAAASLQAAEARISDAPVVPPPAEVAGVPAQETVRTEIAAGPAAAALDLPPAIQGETRVALVIGNSAYQATGALPNPANDAETIAAALRATGFTSVTVVHDLDRAAMVDALRQFRDAADNADWAVVYYAGHGMEMQGTNYLIPVDARLEHDRDVPDEAVSLDRVLAAVEGARKLRLVVLDACRNNPFLAGMQRSEAGRAIGRGLARVEPAQATLVAYAAKDGNIASDGDGANSPFAASLARHLVEPGLEINKIFRLVRSDVLAATGNRQEPFVYGSLPPEDFFFVAGR